MRADTLFAFPVGNKLIGFSMRRATVQCKWRKVMRKKMGWLYMKAIFRPSAGLRGVAVARFAATGIELDQSWGKGRIHAGCHIPRLVLK
jgi:hypothetical protein